jgi:hypothetical protein
MYIVLNIMIPKKFKVHEFIKHSGTKCPIKHLQVYCNKMVEVAHYEKVFILFFYERLNDITLS